jgi:hypothetical protein
MNVRFLGFRAGEEWISNEEEPWFTIGQEYEAEEELGVISAKCNDGNFEPLFDGEYEIVSETE